MKRLTECRRLVALGALALLAEGCSGEERFAAEAREAAGGGDQEVIARRVLNLADLGQSFSFVPSPDGRMIAYEEWDQDPAAGYMSVRDLRTGEVRTLVEDRGRFREAWPLRFSWDGRKLAFMKNMGDPDYNNELRVVGADGAGERSLLAVGRPADAMDWVEVYDWSPDGTALLVQTRKSDRTAHHLKLVSAADGSSRVLRTFDWRWAETAAFSPDGRFVTYDFPSDESSRARDLYLMSIDGTGETRLTSDPEVKRLIGWSRDGAAIYYEVGRFEAGRRVASVWRLPMRDDRAAGAPELVRADLAGVGESSAVMGEDRIFYAVRSGQYPGWSVGLDLESGRIVDAPVPIIEGPISRPGTMGWAPDGSSVVYVRPSRGRRPGLELVLLSVASREERAIPLGLSYVDGRMVWPDGTMLVRGIDRGRVRLVRVDPATGRVSPEEDPALIELVEGPMFRPRFSADMTLKYFWRSDGTGHGLVARDVRSGTDRVLYTTSASSVANPVLSPDDAWIALVETTDEASELRVIPAAGGEARTLHTIDRPGFVGLESINWSADGRTVLFRDHTAEGASRMWKVGVDGGEKVMLFSRSGNLTFPRLSPDGRRLVFLSPDEDAINELWVLENLPETRGAPGR